MMYDNYAISKKWTVAEMISTFKLIQFKHNFTDFKTGEVNADLHMCVSAG